MEELIKRYPALAQCRMDIENAVSLMHNTYLSGGTIYACGNGGSCSDCGHIVGELMKSFMMHRKIDQKRLASLKQIFGNELEIEKKLQGAIPAVDLTAQASILSAFSNDVDPEFMYAQLVYGYAKENDLVIGISTSGNSTNVVNAIKTAKAIGAKTLSLTGKNDSLLSAISDVTIKAPETQTYKIQEYHLPIYHYLCAQLERLIFE